MNRSQDILSGMKIPSFKSSLCRSYHYPFVSQQRSKFIPQTLAVDELICGIYCIEVAIHLVSKGEPSLLGKVCLRTTQVAPTVALADCRCCRAEAWLCFCFRQRGFFKKEHWIIRRRIVNILNCHTFNISWRFTEVLRIKQIGLYIEESVQVKKWITDHVVCWNTSRVPH